MWSSITWYYLHHCSNWDRIWIRVSINKRHPLPRPNGQAMGCLLWEFRENWRHYNGTAVYDYSSLSLAFCHNTSPWTCPHNSSVPLCYHIDAWWQMYEIQFPTTWPRSTCNYIMIWYFWTTTQTYIFNIELLLLHRNVVCIISISLLSLI